MPNQSQPWLAVGSSLYLVLGVTPNASAVEIRSAWKRVAAHHHPDHGGDSARFSEAAIAYEVLGSITQRQTYDRYVAAGTQATGEPQTPSPAFAAAASPAEASRTSSLGHSLARSVLSFLATICVVWLASLIWQLGLVTFVMDFPHLFDSAPALTPWVQLAMGFIAILLGSVAALIAWFAPHRLSKTRLFSYGYALAMTTWGILTMFGFTVSVASSSGKLLCLIGLVVSGIAVATGLLSNSRDLRTI